MALDGTLPGLVASIADFMLRPDLAPAIPDFIKLAEAQMTRRLRCRRMVSRFYASVPAGTEYATLPSDFIGPIDLMTGGDPVRRLQYLTPDSLVQMKSHKRFADDQGTIYYSIVGNTLRFLPLPPGDMTVELVYWLRIPALTEANPTNWVLTDHPDIYLYGALTQSAPYLKDDGRTTVWGTLFTQAIADCNANDPMPGDTAQMRTELSAHRLGSSSYGYNIYTDC